MRHPDSGVGPKLKIPKEPRLSFFDTDRFVEFGKRYQVI